MTDNVTGDRLRSFVDRLETLADERQGVQDQIKEVFGEAKGEGYCTRTLRSIIKLRKLRDHERIEADQMLELY